MKTVIICTVESDKPKFSVKEVSEKATKLEILDRHFAGSVYRGDQALYTKCRVIQVDLNPDEVERVDLYGFELSAVGSLLWKIIMASREVS